MFPQIKSHSIHFPEFEHFLLLYFGTTVRLSEFTSLIMSDLMDGDKYLRPKVTPGLSGSSSGLVFDLDYKPTFRTHPLHLAFPTEGANYH